MWRHFPFVALLVAGLWHLLLILESRDDVVQPVRAEG
jgi:hypothetical protein